MPRQSKQYIHPDKAKRHLRWLLTAFFIALSLPVYLLLEKVYSQLENEVYFNQRNQAELLFDQIEQRLQKAIEEEENRPIAEYSFFNIIESPLLQSSAVKFSPLAEVPPKANIPGLTGFFQINPDSSFHIPALPELEKDYQPTLSQQELDTRKALRERLRQLLAINEPLTNNVATGSKGNRIQDLPVAKKDSKSKTGEVYPLNDVFQPTETDITSIDSVQSKNQTETNTSFYGINNKTQMLSEEQLNELNIDAEHWNKKRSEHDAQKDEKRSKASTSSYRSRKEIVKLPDQSLLSELFNRPNQQSAYSENLEETEGKVTIMQKSKMPPPQMTQEQPALKILSIESEVSPLKMILLKDGYLCFYRNVWHGNGRYIQGFIANSRDFFTAAVQPFIESSHIAPFSSLLLAHDGTLLEQFKTSTRSRETLLYRESPKPPFQHLELIVNTGSVSAEAGSFVVNLLAATLGLVLLAGVLLFYRLGTRQIELARQQRNFISAVSHELKTPLTSIRMYGEILRSQWITDESKKKAYYDYIFFESERLSRLIGNVLQLAKLDNHTERTELVAHDPNRLLQRIKGKTLAQIEAADFQLNIISPETGMQNLVVLIDEDAFFQIMINLIDNAIKFSATADNKVIDVGLKITSRGKDAVFYVRDYGPGIEKKQMKKIFQLFYRAGDELTRTKPGTGIGLALVVQLAARMNAKINLLNRYPGIEFQVKFMI